jgi:hypothetical protein
MTLIAAVDEFMVGPGQTMRLSEILGALRAMFGVRADAATLERTLQAAGFLQMGFDRYAVNWTRRAERLADSFGFPCD